MTALAPYFVLVALILAWVLARNVAVRKRFDLVDLILYFFLLTFVARPALLVLGLDYPWLDEFVHESELADVVAEAMLYVMLWLAVFALCCPLGWRLGGAAWLSSDATGFNERELLFASMVVLVISAFLVVPQIVSAGGFAAFQWASKASSEGVEKMGKVPAVLCSVWSTALLISISWRRRRGEGPQPGDFRYRVAGALILFAGGGMAFAYGARDAFVLSLLALAIASIVGRRFGPATILRSAGLVLAVFAAAMAFRAFRDVNLSGEAMVSMGDDGFFRSVSIMTNQVSFDSLMLLIRDMPQTFPHLGAMPFVESLKTLPGGTLLLGPADPDFSSVARETVRYYLPYRLNGNPVTAIGDWYVSFGAHGIFFGAALSGIVVGWLQKKTSSFWFSPLIFVVIVHLASRYVSFGIWANTATTLYRFAAPLLLTILGMYALRYAGRVPELRQWRQLRASPAAVHAVSSATRGTALVPAAARIAAPVADATPTTPRARFPAPAGEIDVLHRVAMAQRALLDAERGAHERTRASAARGLELARRATSETRMAIKLARRERRARLALRRRLPRAGAAAVPAGPSPERKTARSRMARKIARRERRARLKIVRSRLQAGA